MTYTARLESVAERLEKALGVQEESMDGDDLLHIILVSIV